MYFLCVIRKKEHKSFFLLHLLTNEDGESNYSAGRDSFTL